MATITSQSGTTNFSGEVSKNGNPLLPKSEILVLNETRVKASAGISALKVAVITGYDSGLALPTAATLSSLTQVILGICVSPISSGNPGNITTKGIVTTGLNGTTKAVGDGIYSDSSGNLTFTVTSRRVGTLLTTTTNAVILVDIKQENLDYFTSSLSIPAGCVFPFTGAAAPTGFLKCDGTSYLTATYPNLFAVIAYNYGGAGANFNVPDYRGMFLRGTGTHGTLQDATGANFAGPALHASQNDMEQGHIHDYVIDAGAGTGLVTSNVTGIYSLPAGSAQSAGGSITISGQTDDGVNGTPRTGAETRPVNFGVNFIIKT